VARLAERLPHLGKGLPVLPALQKLPHQTYSIGCFYAAGSHFLSRSPRPLGPLSTLAGYIYCLTAFNRFTCCPELVSIPDITAETLARALLTGWKFRFGCPQTITNDQGHQFESKLFHSLAKLCGIQHSGTNAHHPASN
jgi:transposase InsO family protein